MTQPTTFRDALDSLLPALNDKIDWSALQEALPQVKGNTLLLVITGENSAQYGLLVDNRSQELRIVNPNLIPRPTTLCQMDYAIAWDLLRKTTTRKQLMGVFLRYQSTGLVSTEALDGKMLYHAQMLAYLWELLQQAALAKETP